MIDINNINWPKLTINLIIAYIISWTYFTLIVSYLQKILGTTIGVVSAYLSSWTLLIFNVYLLHKINPKGDT